MRTCNSCGATGEYCGRNAGPCLDTCTGCDAVNREPCKVWCHVAEVAKYTPVMIGALEFDFATAYEEEQKVKGLLAENKKLKSILYRCAERATSMMYLYPNYRVDARGPRGLCWDILRETHPEAFDYLQTHDWDDTYQKFFAED